MKQYRFDYIREWVEQWNECIPKTLETIENLPFDIFIWSTPSKDHYGDDIEDYCEWQRQRHEYCVELAEEYQRKEKYMNKEWKPEDLENLLKINDSFREKCKHIVKIINEIYVEVTGKSEPFCFEDFHIDEQRVFFNVCYADGPLRKNMRSFPCSLLTMNEDSELKREILKLMIVEGVEGDKLSVDELVEIVKNITETRKETEVLDEE